jgi:hypothetical protein
MTTLDYAEIFEREFRPRCRLSIRLRYVAVLVVWAAVFLVRPNLALTLWQERRG